MPTLYRKGDFVLYLGKQAMVNDTVMHKLGFLEYMVVILDDGKIVKANSLQLEKCDLEMPDEEPEIDLSDIEVIMDPSPSPTRDKDEKDEANEKESIPNKKGRFAKKSEEEVRELADKKLAKGTKSVTSWGVGVLQGTCNK